jgi:predicted nucleic acid-binding protein
VIADTTFLIDLHQERQRGQRGAASHFLATNRTATIRITVVSVAEFAAGLPNNAAARVFVATFPIVRLFPEAAREAASVDRELIRSGQRLGENDTLIAGIARYFGEPLVSNDGDFARVANLRVVRY